MVKGMSAPAYQPNQLIWWIGYHWRNPALKLATPSLMEDGAGVKLISLAMVTYWLAVRDFMRYYVSPEAEKADMLRRVQQTQQRWAETKDQLPYEDMITLEMDSRSFDAELKRQLF